MKTNKLSKFVATIFVASVAFAPIAIGLVGCATPQQAAYKTSASVVHSVDIAMSGWADYVVAERVRIATLSADQQGPANDELLRKEGTVLTAYGNYQTVVRLGAAISTTNSAKSVAQAAADLIKLINETKK